MTRTAEGQITVWIDGIQVIQETDTTVDVESCEYFIVSLNKEWAIDNVIVDDEITVGQIPFTLIAVSGSAATIIILVTLGLRIKRT
ncbi:MAG: hypothetical protein ACE5H4_14020 [Candidatus Thorarchaeota archaeon]